MVDTVGAGDAFSSVILLGLMQGWPLAETMRRAQAFASRICQQRGATTANIALYKEVFCISLQGLEKQNAFRAC